MSIEDKLDLLRLEYLAHGSMVVKNEETARHMGRKLLQLCNNRNVKPLEYFCCLECGLPRALDKGTQKCNGCVGLAQI